MTEDVIYQKLKDIITVYLPDDVSADAIKMDTHLVRELNINSAHLVDIILDVEDAFDIQLENEDMEAMQTVQDAMGIINKKRSGK
jgi:acyl carrier protein